MQYSEIPKEEVKDTSAAVVNNEMQYSEMPKEEEMPEVNKDTSAPVINNTEKQYKCTHCDKVSLSNLYQYGMIIPFLTAGVVYFRHTVTNHLL